MKRILFLLLFFTITTAFSMKDNRMASITNARLGMAYLKKGYYSLSKERLLSALRDDPHIASSWYSMGYYLEKTGNPNQAKTYYLKAISVEPHSGAAKNNYGTFLCRQKHYYKAMHYFLAAVAEPSYIDVASAYENAGACAMMIPNNKLAAVYFRKAIDNNPSMPFSMINLARLDYQSGDVAGAKKYYSQFKKMNLQNASPQRIAHFHEFVFTKPSPHS